MASPGRLRHGGGTRDVPLPPCPASGRRLRGAALPPPTRAPRRGGRRHRAHFGRRGRGSSGDPVHALLPRASLRGRVVVRARRGRSRSRQVRAGRCRGALPPSDRRGADRSPGSRPRDRGGPRIARRPARPPRRLRRGSRQLPGRPSTRRGRPARRVEALPEGGLDLGPRRALPAGAPVGHAGAPGTRGRGRSGGGPATSAPVRVVRGAPPRSRSVPGGHGLVRTGDQGGRGVGGARGARPGVLHPGLGARGSRRAREGDVFSARARDLPRARQPRLGCHGSQQHGHVRVLPRTVGRGHRPLPAGSRHADQDRRHRRCGDGADEHRRDPLRPGAPGRGRGDVPRGPPVPGRPPAERSSSR